MSKWKRAPQSLQILLLMWPASLLSAVSLFLLNGSLTGLVVVAMVAVVFGLFLVFNVKGTAVGMAEMIRPQPKNRKGRRAKHSPPPLSPSQVRTAGAALIVIGTLASVLLGLALW